MSCVSSFHSLCLATLALEYTKPAPVSRPFYLLFSLPGTLVSSLSLANTFVSSHFFPKCYLPRAAFSSPDSSTTRLGYCACLPSAYAIWNFPLIYLLVYFLFLPLPHILICSKKISSKGQVLHLSSPLLPSLGLEQCATHGRHLINNCWINKYLDISSS